MAGTRLLAGCGALRHSLIWRRASVYRWVQTEPRYSWRGALILQLCRARAGEQRWARALLHGACSGTQISGQPVPPHTTQHSSSRKHTWQHEEKKTKRVRCRNMCSADYHGCVFSRDLNLILLPHVQQPPPPRPIPQQLRGGGKTSGLGSVPLIT